MAETVLPIMFYFTFKERDRSSQLKQSIRHVQTASCFSFPDKGVVRRTPGSCVLLLIPPS